MKPYQEARGAAASRDVGSRDGERRLRMLALALAVVVASGVLGYMAVEGWSFLDALYMTVITLATVGYREVQPLTPAGMVLTMVLIVAGFGTVLVFFVAITEYIVSGALGGSLRRRRMQRDIDALTGHMIVCGYGRVGQHVVDDLRAKGERVVVVEAREVPLGFVDERQFLVVGDATDEQVLHLAGIERARGLVAATGDDAVNIVLTLTARAMNPELVIVARADQAATEAKLRRAGATRVISLYRIAGHRIAAQLRNPRVADFLETVMHGDLELLLEDVPVAGGSALAGRTMEQSGLREQLGVNVLAVAKAGGVHVSNPPGSLRLDAGDELIVLGTARQLEALVRLAGAAGHAIA